MLKKYEHKIIEKDSQNFWKNNNLFFCNTNNTKKNFYCLQMFPYPSGTLHMGHVRSYTIGDTFARIYRMQGYNVLQPMGFDAFGLPAENAANKHNLSPKQWTTKNINQMRSSINCFGYSYDWSKEIITSDPHYFMWEQKLFIDMYKKGQAYRKKTFVNWDPVDKTVLANEQVINGRGWRSNALIERKEINQWFLKITDYAKQLYEMIPSMQWPESVKKIQANWIGQKVGISIKIDIYYDKKILVNKVSCFVQKAELVFSASFISLSPNHEIISHVIKVIPSIKEKIKFVSKKDPILTNLYGIFNNKAYPIVINHFIDSIKLSVPASDASDRKIADLFNLPIVEINKNMDRNTAEQFFINKDLAIRDTHYRLRDWCISRQRSWGAPIPMILCVSCGYQPEKNLPVLDRLSPACCPKCKQPAKREQDTFDTFMESSWYYARYICKDYKKDILDKEIVKKWLPVDVYIGGIEHANLHFLYARYIHKVMRDLGYFSNDEPFKKVICQGMILNKGFKMSKSKDNTISAEEIVKKYGADTLRMFVVSAAPIENDFEWCESGIIGHYRLLEKIFNACTNLKDAKNQQIPEEVKDIVNYLNQAIKKNKVNTIVSSVNKLLNISNNRKDLMLIVLQTLHPVAPHLTCYLYRKFYKNDNILKLSYPYFDIESRANKIMIQLNSKRIDIIQVQPNLSQEQIKAIVFEKYPYLINLKLTYLNKVNIKILNFNN